jgi:hypothetical protein
LGYHGKCGVERVRGVVRHGEAVSRVVACRVSGELFDSNALVFHTEKD